MHDLTRAAVAYLAAGLHLLALNGKRPNPKFHEHWDWDNSIHGLPESPEDEEALDRVFGDRTTTGVAILIPQHVLVADIDTEDAAALYMDLAGDLPDTRVARTPNGIHVWFLAPGADSSVWLGGRTLLFKGFGGYVAAPPSRHFDSDGLQDGVYTWIGDWGIIDWMPDPLADAIQKRRALDALEPAHTREGSAYLYVPVDADGRWTRQGWSAWNIDGLCRAITDAPDGNQNNMIAWAAMQARDEGVPFDVAMPLLLAAAVKGNHPEHRARTTIRGAYQRGRRDR